MAARSLTLRVLVNIEENRRTVEEEKKRREEKGRDGRGREEKRREEKFASLLEAPSM